MFQSPFYILVFIPHVRLIFTTIQCFRVDTPDSLNCTRIDKKLSKLIICKICKPGKFESIIIMLIGLVLTYPYPQGSIHTNFIKFGWEMSSQSLKGRDHRGYLELRRSVVLFIQYHDLVFYTKWQVIIHAWCHILSHIVMFKTTLIISTKY